MQRFADRKDNEWSIDINAYTIEKVRTDVGVDLLTFVEGEETIKAISDDDIKLVAIVASLTEEQRDASGKTDDDFKRDMNGESIEAAWDAIILDLIDFFPPGRREVLKAAYQKLKASQKLSEQRAMEIIEGDALDKALAIQRSKSEKLFTSAVESLGQPTQAGANSEN